MEFLERQRNGKLADNFYLTMSLKELREEINIGWNAETDYRTVLCKKCNKKFTPKGINIHRFKCPKLLTYEK